MSSGDAAERRMELHDPEYLDEAQCHGWNFCTASEESADTYYGAHWSLSEERWNLFMRGVVGSGGRTGVRFEPK